MYFDQGFGNSQTQARLPVPLLARFIGPVEAVEDIGQIFGRNAAAGIVHLQRHFGFTGAGRQDDLSSSRGVTQSIVDQIAQNLSHTIWVRRNGGQVTTGLDDERDVFPPPGPDKRRRYELTFRKAHKPANSASVRRHRPATGCAGRQPGD